MTISTISDAFKVQCGMMRTVGIWPDKNQTVIYRFKNLLTYISQLALWLTMWMQFQQVITDVKLLSEILYIMITVTASLIKLASFRYHEKSFLKLLNLLNNPILISYSKDMDHYMAKTIKYSTIIAKIYRFLVFCCILLFGVVPLIDNKPLPFPFDFDFAKRHTVLMYVFQLFTALVAAWENSTMDTLCTSIMGIEGAQLDVLAEKIKSIKFSTESEGAVAANKFTQCVQHHLAIIQCVELSEDVFGLGLLAQFLGSIIVLCNTMFHFVVISAESLQFWMLANYLLILMFQLFMYCWYGNNIITKSLEIRNACYLSTWYNNGCSYQKSIFLTMERSKRPLCIRAMKFSTLSLSTFTAILQWSYSCLTLLLKMYYKKNTQKL